MGELNINLPKVKGTNITNFQSSDELWKAFFEFLEGPSRDQSQGDAPRSRRYSFFVPGMSDPIAPCFPPQGAQPQHHINVAHGAPSHPSSSQPTLVSLLIKAALQQDKYN